MYYRCDREDRFNFHICHVPVTETQLDDGKRPVQLHTATFHALLLSLDRGAITVTDSRTDATVLYIPAPSVTVPSLTAAISERNIEKAHKVIKTICNAQTRLNRSLNSLKELSEPPSQPQSLQSTINVDTDNEPSQLQLRRSARVHGHSQSLTYADADNADSDDTADDIVDVDTRPVKKFKSRMMNADELIQRYRDMFIEAANAPDNGLAEPYQWTLRTEYAAIKKHKSLHMLSDIIQHVNNLTAIIKDAAIDTMIAYFIKSVVAHKLKNLAAKDIMDNG
jgi:hypothetical protein